MKQWTSGQEVVTQNPLVMASIDIFWSVNNVQYSSSLFQDNLMRKLACKTLMEILPSDVANNISQEIADKKLSIDFDTVVGLVVG